MRRLNQVLVTTLGLGWLAFLVLGLGIRTFATPSVVVLIDQSYCPPEAWIRVSHRYQRLFEQHQQKRIRIEQVITFSSLSQAQVDPIPTPEQVQSFNTFGRPGSQREASLLAQYPYAEVLKCEG